MHPAPEKKARRMRTDRRVPLNLVATIVAKIRNRQVQQSQQELTQQAQVSMIILRMTEGRCDKKPAKIIKARGAIPFLLSIVDESQKETSLGHEDAKKHDRRDHCGLMTSSLGA